MAHHRWWPSSREGSISAKDGDTRVGCGLVDTIGGVVGELYVGGAVGGDGWGTFVGKVVCYHAYLIERVLADGLNFLSSGVSTFLTCPTNQASP